MNLIIVSRDGSKRVNMMDYWIFVYNHSVISYKFVDITFSEQFFHTDANLLDLEIAKDFVWFAESYVLVAMGNWC